MVNNLIGFTISEAFKSMSKQKIMTILSIMIMIATMFMFGVFFVIGENINYIMVQIEAEQGMQVNILDDATNEQIEELGNNIRKIEGVNNVTFRSKEDALATMKENLGEHQELLDSYVEDNPFPASYFVTLTDLSLNEQVQAQIKELDFVDDISSRNDTISNLEKVARVIRVTSYVLLSLLVIVSLFIIAYTIKLTVHARRREISIMKYVGGTNNFIRGPFIVEGIVIGIISSLISLLAIGIMYVMGLGKILESNMFSFSTISFYSFSDIFGKILCVYLLLGVGMGVIGSTISMKRYLDV